MKDKIIEILKEFSVMSTGHDDYYYTIPGSKLKDAAIAIDSLYPTLNRDKVMDDLHIFISQTIGATRGECDYPSIPELADAICSLYLPTLSEGEIETAAAKLGQAEQPKNKELRKWLSRGFRKGAKWATKQLAKPKEEKR